MTRALLVLTLLACNGCKDTSSDRAPPDSDSGVGADSAPSDSDSGADSSSDTGSAEICDGEDNDLDGNIPAREIDGDGDGVLPCRQALWVDTINFATAAPGYGLSEALAEEAVGLLTARGVTVDWEALNPDLPWSKKLAEVRLLILQGDWSLGGLTAADATALESWVNEGGSLVWIGQHPMQSSCDAVNALPTAFGVSCDNSGYSYWEGTTTNFEEHEVTEGLGEIVGYGGDIWDFTEPPAQVLADVKGSAFLAVVEHGEGRVVFVADEWPFYNAGTNVTYDISAADNGRLVSNIWAWTVRD